MKPIYLYSVIALAAIGCSAQQNLLTTEKTLAENKIAPRSIRVGYSLKTQGLPSGGFWKSTPVLTDINQDGILDLATHSRDENSTHVWLGQPHETWLDASQGLALDSTCGGGVDFADINKDGKLDIAVADHCAGIFVYLGRKNTTWQLTKQLSSALEKKAAIHSPDLNTLKGNEDVALGDINEDGFIDVVASAADEGGFTVFLGDGSAKKWKETASDGLPSAQDPGTEEYSAGWAIDVQLHDMNNDKHLDIVATNYTGPHVWLGDGKGHWQSKAQGLTVTDMGGTYRKLAVADINNDGLKDLAVTNDLSGAESYLQNADGSWQKPVDMLPALKAGATAIALGDLDGDGHIDAVIGGLLALTENAPSGLHIVLGDGKGHWQEEQGTQLPTQGLDSVWGIALADLNGDKHLDIVATTGSMSAAAEKNQPPQKKSKASQLPHLQVWLSEPVQGKTL